MPVLKSANTLPKDKWRCLAPPFIFWVSSSHYQNRFFESSPKGGFQKTDFCVSCTKGAGNTKIGFIMRIAAFGLYALSKTYIAIQ